MVILAVCFAVFCFVVFGLFFFFGSVGLGWFSLQKSSEKPINKGEERKEEKEAKSKAGQGIEAKIRVVDNFFLKDDIFCDNTDKSQ